MNTVASQNLLHTQWTNFNSNFGALYTFFDNLTETADRLDLERKKRLASGLAEIFGENAEEVEREILQYSPSIDDLDVFPDFRNDASVKEMMREIKDESFISKIRDWENRHPHKSHKLAKLIFSLFGNPPISGFILRKSMLITSVTFLEVLIEQMYINHYLLQGYTKEEAIIKAEELHVRSWYKRLNNLSKIGIPVETISLYRDQVLQLTNLRNLFVHNDGIVDQSFLDQTSEKVFSGLQPGQVVVVSTKRLQRVLDFVFSFGLLLCQSHWRLHEKDDKLPNAKIEQLLLTAFDEKRYSFILELTEKLEILDINQNVKQRLLVDRAIAYRDLDRLDEVEKIVTVLELCNYDWQIEIAISTLKKDWSQLHSQIRQAAAKYDIRRIVHWPLFEPIRNEIWFRMAFTSKKRSFRLTQVRKKRK